jgi:hypothetical protein
LLNDIVADVAEMDGVAYASMVDYDTVVIGKENYSDYINGKTSSGDQTAGKNPWFGESLRDHVERAITRLEGKQGQVGEGNVPSVSEEPSQKLSLRTSYPTAKAAEDAAYRKAPPTTSAFKRWFGKSIVKEEGRPLVIVPRETPLSVIHLRNLTTLAEANVRIVPAIPAWYHNPQTIEDLVDFVVARTLDQLDIDCVPINRWQGDRP